MPSMVIDVHTHVFPAGSTEKIFSTLKERAHVSHYSDGTVGGLQDSMERAGIDISIISRITTKPQQVDRDKCRSFVWPMREWWPDTFELFLLYGYENIGFPKRIPMNSKD